MSATTRPHQNLLGAWTHMEARLGSYGSAIGLLRKRVASYLRLSMGKRAWLPKATGPCLASCGNVIGLLWSARERRAGSMVKRVWLWPPTENFLRETRLATYGRVLGLPRAALGHKGTMIRKRAWAPTEARLWSASVLISALGAHIWKRALSTMESRLEACHPAPDLQGSALGYMWKRARKDAWPELATYGPVYGSALGLSASALVLICKCAWPHTDVRLARVGHLRKRASYHPVSCKPRCRARVTPAKGPASHSTQPARVCRRG